MFKKYKFRKIKRKIKNFCGIKNFYMSKHLFV